MEEKKLVLPGGKLGVIEEVYPGDGTYTSDGLIRALRIGKPVYRKEEREMTVVPTKINLIPIEGDVVIGQIEAVQSNSMTMSIDYINGERSRKRFSGVILIPRDQGQRGRQRKTHCKLGDIVRASVISTTNAMIQMTIQGSEYGVIHAECSICGGRAVMVASKLNCPACGNIEERTLAEDYGVQITS